MAGSVARLFVPVLVIVLALEISLSFANDTRDNDSFRYRFAEFKRQPSVMREHQESYVAPAKNVAEVTNDLLLRMRDASGNNGKFISGRRPLARVRRSSNFLTPTVHDPDVGRHAFGMRRARGSGNVHSRINDVVRRVRGNVHAHINDVVRRASGAAEDVLQSDTSEGCMDPLDANYSSMASIHNGAMCDVNCEEVVADLRAESALTLSVLPSLEDGSIAERSSATSFAIAVEVSWKYLEATMAFLTETGSQADVESFDIGFSHGFIGVSVTTFDLEIDESVWTREYKRQCFDTFVANVPWSEMVDLLWSTGANADEVQGKIQVHTVEPITFNSDFESHRDFPELNRTWQGILPFAMAFPDEVNVVGDLPNAPAVP